MKSRIMETIALLLCICLISCNKADNPILFDPCNNDPCNCNELDTIDYKYSLLWNNKFHDKSNRSVSTTPFVIEEVLITSYLGDDGLHSIINGHNSISGNKLWERVYHISNKAVLHHYSTKHSHNNTLILSYNYLLYGINSATGEVIWKTEKMQDNLWSDPSSVIIDNYIYYGGRTMDSTQKKSFLFRRDINNPYDEEIIIEYSDIENFDLLLGLPSRIIQHNTDTILIFMGKGFNLNESKTNYFGFNLSKRQIIWKNEFLAADGKWQIPIIDNNKVFIAPTSNSIACLDAYSGTILWHNQLPDPGFMQSGDIILEENVLLVLNNMGTLYAFDPESGVEIWKQQTAEWASSPVKMEAHKGILYVANGGLGCQLSAWDVHTGENYWCEYSVNAICKPDCYISSSGLTIDKERGLLYTTDGYDILCIKTIR